MARELIFARQADQDLFEILDYIAKDNQQASEALAARVDHALSLLMEFPNMGPHSPATGHRDMRKVSVPPYVIYYLVLGDGIKVARVLHAARDVDDEYFAS